MNYKRLHFSGILLIIVCSLSINTYAQQDPMYTHYMFNKLVYNPAYAGTDREFIDVTFLYHNQWLGFGSNKYIDPRYADYVAKPPQTQTFSIHGPIGNSLGLGLYAINDIEGYNFVTKINLAFSYKKDFGFGSLHFGLNGGFVQAGINGKWLPPEAGFDDRLPTEGVSDFAPDLGAGIYLFSTRYFIGVSAQHLLRSEFDWTDKNGGKYIMERVYFASAGYNLLMPNNPLIELQPSILWKKDPGKGQFEANINAVYNQRFWGGISYKQGDLFSLLLGMKLTPHLKFGYSYDYTANQMRKTQTGTHEVMVDYIFKIVIVNPPQPKIIIWTPRFL